jgi:hypothetical protein
MLHNVNKNFLLLILFMPFVLGIYLCYIGGYGSDEDTLAMINSFESILFTGHYQSSRFTGYPVAEIIIGFFSLYFGSFYINLVIYLSFIISLFFIFLTFENKESIKLYTKKFILFLIFCISNPILYFDNIEPVDYSLAFLFFSLGTFLYSKKLFQLSYIFFIICLGSRLNFAIFVIIFIIFFNFKNIKVSNQEKLNSIILILFGGSLFYVPIWFINNFGFDWLTSARPTDQGIFGLFGRFIYKTYQVFGVISSFIIFCIFIKIFKSSNFKFEYKNKLLLLIILSNLLIFLYIPAEYSYIQPAVILTYLYILNNLKNYNWVYLLVFFNFISWFVNIDLIEKKFENNNYSICSTVHAIDAKIKFSFQPGYFEKYLKSRNNILCLINHSKGSQKYNNISQGKKLLLK